MKRYPVEVRERGNTLARIDYDGNRYTVTNYDGRVSSDVDRFKELPVMKKWLEAAYPKADELAEV